MDDSIIERGNALSNNPPLHEHSLYGVINGYLQYIFPPWMGFHVKPQYWIKAFASAASGHARKDSSSSKVEPKGTVMIPDVVVSWIPNPEEEDIDQIPVVIIEAKRVDTYTDSDWREWTTKVRRYVKYYNDERFGGRGDEKTYKDLRQNVPCLLICNATGYWAVHTNNPGIRKVAIDSRKDRNFVARSIYDLDSPHLARLWELRESYYSKYKQAQLPFLQPPGPGEIAPWLFNFIKSRDERQVPDDIVEDDAIVDGNANGGWSQALVDRLERTESSVHGPVNTRFLYKWPLEKGYLNRPQGIIWTPLSHEPRKQGHQVQDSQGNDVWDEVSRIPDFILAQMTKPVELMVDNIKVIAELKLKDTEKNRLAVTKQIKQALQDTRENYGSTGRSNQALAHGMVVLGMRAWHVGWKSVGRNWEVEGPDFKKEGVLINVPNSHSFWKRYDRAAYEQ